MNSPICKQCKWSKGTLGAGKYLNAEKEQLKKGLPAAKIHTVTLLVITKRLVEKSETYSLESAWS